MLYLFIQDNGWAGCIVAVAETEEKARIIMKNEYNYSDKPVNKYPIEEGFLFANYGDS